MSLEVQALRELRNIADRQRGPVEITSRVWAEPARSSYCKSRSDQAWVAYVVRSVCGSQPRRREVGGGCGVRTVMREGKGNVRGERGRESRSGSGG